MFRSIGWLQDGDWGDRWRLVSWHFLPETSCPPAAWKLRCWWYIYIYRCCGILSLTLLKKRESPKSHYGSVKDNHRANSETSESKKRKSGSQKNNCGQNEQLNKSSDFFSSQIQIIQKHLQEFQKSKVPPHSSRPRRRRGWKRPKSRLQSRLKRKWGRDGNLEIWRW